MFAAGGGQPRNGVPALRVSRGCLRLHKRGSAVAGAGAEGDGNGRPKEAPAAPRCGRV